MLHFEKPCVSYYHCDCYHTFQGVAVVAAVSAIVIFLKKLSAS